MAHDNSSAASGGLELFSAPTATWFRAAFAEPTRVQREAWAAIAKRKHTLVVAPTGSGKTLAAFLWAIDRVMRERGRASESDAVVPGSAAPQSEPAPGSAPDPDAPDSDAPDSDAPDSPAERPARGTRILYISPLKALGVDVERNLNAPLVGIAQTAQRLGYEVPQLTVGVRSGDTPPAERRRQQAKPPDILITTPESLFLLLTSQARRTLRHVDTVIIDEVHAVAATKRGAHLALSLERLDALLDRPAQRIGLSATVRPLDAVAQFLGGQAPVDIVAPPSEKSFDLRIVVPVEDLSDIAAGGPGEARRTTGDAEYGDSAGNAGDAPIFGDASQSIAHEQRAGSVWPHIEAEILDRVLAHRATIVFVNSRGLAERLTARLNELYDERQSLATPPEDLPAPPPPAPSPPSQPPPPSPAEQRESRQHPNPRLKNATLIGGSGEFAGAAPELARAHHGSVSKETRAEVEDALKSGRLRCVVATSSLELGIDMGDVDLVIQVEAPWSVASGLQRLGRAGHQVGEVSRGVIFPKHRADVLHSAVVASRMLAGSIEALTPITNPLDVLAQQTIAASALDRWQAEDWFNLVRRSAPFATLSRALLDSVLDLLAGRYPSDEFAQLRPRIVWDRELDAFTGRPGAQRLAVTSGGTIPDRGTFGVFMLTGTEDLPDDGTAPRRVVGRRVGELDEEMVYESRVGDVIALGSTSWRIREIGPDQVRVTPAFGEPGRLPFWIGDALGRPAELGAAMGAFAREYADSEADNDLDGLLDSFAAANLRGYLHEMREIAGHIPSDRTLVVERHRDELGDWRIVLHSPYGRRVHGPWALMVTARMREQFGLEASAIASDDGIIVRLPDIEAEPPGAELFDFAPDEIEQLVTREVGGSALFAARFRENAARALILPRSHPGKRSPLWQQRLRAAQLLEVARRYPEFPIVLETVREVLHDVYDLDALHELLQGMRSRSIRVVTVTTGEPSPFARTLLFGYVGAFMYEGDQPLAERRAAALALDMNLLGDLLGTASLRELLDAEAITAVESELQRTAAGWQARDIEGIVDLLRVVGPLDAAEVAARIDADAHLDAAAALHELVAARRAIEVRIAGREVYAAVEDAARLRDGLGTPMPLGVPAVFLEPVADPLADLVGRYARTHAPFTTAAAAEALGLGQAVVADVLRRLEVAQRVVHGEFTPGREGTEWVDEQVLRRIRSRTLAKLRREVEPVSQRAYAQFLAEWQHVRWNQPAAAHDRKSAATRAIDTDGLEGIDGLTAVIEQLHGVPLPASAWESLILPARIRDYQPPMLDGLLASGEVRWQGHGAIGASDGWVSLSLTELLPLAPAPQPEAVELSPLAQQLRAQLASAGAMFFPELVRALGDNAPQPAIVADALWELAWAGCATTDALAPMRALLAAPGGRASTSAHRTPRRAARGRLYRGGLHPGPVTPTPPHAAGRWSLTPNTDSNPSPLDAAERAGALGELLLYRYGVVTKGTVTAADVPGGFAAVYQLLAKFEQAGHARRGYFVTQLGAAQFATVGAIDRLRAIDRTTREQTEGYHADALPRAVTLAATDPANPFGAALPWPELAQSKHRPGRKAGGLVTLVDGQLVFYVERGGKTMLQFTDDDQLINQAAESLAATVRAARIPDLVIERINGNYALETDTATRLQQAGFSATPRGFRMRVHP